MGDYIWMINEWFEVNSIEDTRWFEPMMDVEARYSRVDILEYGDARPKVHWHYALCNPEYEICNGNTTADEYYTIYPDGIAVRRLVGLPGNQSDYGENLPYPNDCTGSWCYKARNGVRIVRLQHGFGGDRTGYRRSAVTR